MATRQWVRGSNPPALTDTMRAAGQKWQRLNPSKGGFLWEVAPADRTPQGVAGAPSGAHSAPRGV